MVARKPTAKAASTELANFDEELARLGRGAKKTVADVGLGRSIGLQGGTMMYNGAEVAGNKLQCIVIDSILVNTYYDVAYKADTPTSPVCFAYGVVDLDDPDAAIEMAPHEEASAPQNPVCGKAGQEGCCPFNEWESADTGRGKACQNRRKLCIIPYDADTDPSLVAAIEHAYLTVPVTSVAPWAAYVKQLDTMFNGKPPLAFVTEIALVPDKGTQFKLTFKLVEEVDRAWIGGLLKKHAAVQADMVQPYPKPQEEAPKSAARGRSASKISGRAAPAKKPAGRR